MPPLSPGETIKGKQWGVRFNKRSSTDNHICIQLMCEDDEQWFDVDGEGGSGICSSFWLPDLIGVLELAQDALERRAEPDKSGFGFVFK
jgi:hypothetical protein